MKQRRQDDHNLRNIDQAFSNLFEKAKERQAFRKQFMGYLVLDALTGNTDRHHDNWGILVLRTRVIREQSIP